MNTRILAITLVLSATPAFGINVIEVVDFSNSGLAPNAFTLDPGLNIVLGSVGFVQNENLENVVDRDYIALTVPGGYQLSSLVLGPGTTVGGAFSFVGVQDGPVMTVSPTSGSAVGLLGWAHYGTADVGTDILPLMGSGSGGATGFVPPLPAGQYTFWVQDFSLPVVGYEYQITVTAVPEPSAWILWAIAASALPLSCRRRR